MILIFTCITIVQICCRNKIKFKPNQLNVQVVSFLRPGEDGLHGDVESSDLFVEDIEVEDIDNGESWADLSSASSSDSFPSSAFAVVGGVFLLSGVLYYSIFGQRNGR